jgi:hypothetical protein
MKKLFLLFILIWSNSTIFAQTPCEIQKQRIIAADSVLRSDMSSTISLLYEKNNNTSLLLNNKVQELSLSKSLLKIEQRKNLVLKVGIFSIGIGSVALVTYVAIKK